jgi:hypothetical protein
MESWVCRSVFAPACDHDGRFSARANGGRAADGGNASDETLLKRLRIHGGGNGVELTCEGARVGSLYTVTAKLL